jgi:hypothetical protein
MVPVMAAKTNLLFCQRESTRASLLALASVVASNARHLLHHVRVLIDAPEGLGRFSVAQRTLEREVRTLPNSL